MSGQELQVEVGSPERESERVVSSELSSAMQGGHALRIILEVKRSASFGPSKSLKELALWRERERLSELARTEKARSVFGAAPADSKVELDRNLVQLRREIFDRERLAFQPDKIRVTEMLRTLGAKRVASVELGGVIAAEVLPTAIETLAASGMVRKMYLDKPAKLLNTFPFSVGTYSLGSHYFWQAGWIGQGQSVAVIDSGIDAAHPYFSGLNVESRSMLSVEDIPEELRPCLADDISSSHDFNGHGSHVAGIIAGRRFGNYEYSWGVSPGIEKLYSFKVGFQLRHDHGCPGSAPISMMAASRALEFLLHETPVRLVNYSAGSDLKCEDDDSFMSRRFDYFSARFPDLAITVAAGNDGPNVCTIGSPGNAYNVTSVGNTDHSFTLERWDDLPHWSSSRGPSKTGRMKPDLSAPGTRILSVQANSGELIEMDGTSMAAPHIAGALALLSEAGVAHPLQAKALLVNSADSASWSTAAGWGQANLERALAWRGTSQMLRFEPKSPSRRLRYLRVKDVPGVWSTLTWNRHIQASTGELDELPWRLSMGLYDAQTGSPIQEIKNSDRTIQNLLKLGAATSREAVLRISMDDVQFFEQEEVLEAGFSSTSGWEELTAPALSVNCTGPDTVTLGANVEVDCTIRNSGQAPLHNLTVGTQRIARIAGGSTANAKLQIQAPNGLGPASASIEVRANSYGYSYPANTVVRFVVNAPAAQLGALLFTRSQPPASCGRPVASQTFTISDSKIWVWASVTGVNQGQLWKVVVRNPMGGLHRSFGPYAFQSSGDFCLYPEVPLAGASSSPMIGTWVVSVEIDGRLMGSSTFQVFPPQPTVSSIVFTPYAPNMNSCAAPLGYGTISRSAQIVYSWFVVDNLAMGAAPQVRWIAPSGQVALRSDMRPVSGAGSWCFSSSISMSGLLPNAIPGAWRVEIALSGVVIRTAVFNMM